MSKTKDIAVTASKHITLIAVCAATLVVGKLALSFIPNIEVVTTLIVVYAYVFGCDALGATTVFCALDIIIYPPSLDVIISYFIYWNALAGVIILIKALGANREYAFIAAAVAMTALFGLLTSFMAHVVLGLPFLPTYLAGIPFYVAQIISTLVFMSVGFNPLRRCLEKVRTGIYKK